jgi:hypothetical protein
MLIVNRFHPDAIRIIPERNWLGNHGRSPFLELALALSIGAHTELILVLVIAQRNSTATTLGSLLITKTENMRQCKGSKAKEALLQMRVTMGKLKQTANQEKTRICQVPEGEFAFMGYTFGQRHSPMTGRMYIALRRLPEIGSRLTRGFDQR